MKLITLLAFGLTASVAAGADSFYKEQPLFSTAPAETASLQSIDRFGPVGIGIELHQPAFVMKVKNIEPGSPAAATGKLKSGQIIETINGQNLKDIDPRIQLGDIITTAEASDGLVKLVVRDAPEASPQEVLVKIPVLGTYSKTWPLNCLKSDKIVRGFADYTRAAGPSNSFGAIGMLFLLSTGEDQDLDPVRAWARGSAQGAPTYAWHLGFGGIPLCEYYLRTGDQAVLPTIQGWVNSAVKAQYLDGWAGRGGVAAVTYGGGGGHLNAGGTAVVTFLLLAKECGAEVPDHALLGALGHFYRWAGRGNNPYGDNRPEDGMVDNGKNGNLAFAMAAAASLTPNGEQSVYAGARDAAALTGFYTTTFMLHGHTGGGIGEIWRSSAMGLLQEKMPVQYREFMDNRRWHYELSRRFDGSFGILGGASYDTVAWGAGYALTYTVPRKTLRISGAPPSKYSKPFRLPQRPWGTRADDTFESIEPVAYPDGTRPDFSRETLAVDSGRPLLARFSKNEVGDEMLRRYIHHPDHFVRLVTARKTMGLDTLYLGKAIDGGGKPRPALMQEFVRSEDPRVRRAAINAIATALNGDALSSFIRPAMLDLFVTMLKDPEESWWVKDAVLNVFARLPAKDVAPHVDLILPYVKHQEWWLQSAALNALGPLAADPHCYQRILPAIGEMLRTCQRFNATHSVEWEEMLGTLRAAAPEVQKLATESLKSAYTGFAGVKTAPGGQDITTTYNSQMDFLANTLAGTEGGYDLLYKLGKERFPEQLLPYSSIFLSADPASFGPELQRAIGPIIRDQLVYEYLGRNHNHLLAEAQATRQSSTISSGFDNLAALYRKVGVHDYDWHVAEPNLKKATWDYFTFDPPEQQQYDISPWRYRKVTLPEGMENWFNPSFDPAQAGWKKGQAPFGQYEGKLLTDPRPRGRFNSPDPMRTLWDKEVLLVRGTFQLPTPKTGYLYRIVVSTGLYVGAGDGYRLYLNGKQLVEVKEGIGRNSGGTLRGAFITRELLDEFGKGPVTLAATTFLRFGDRAIVTMPPVPQGVFSMWIEEMKLPPLDDAAFRKSATVIPMLSAAWQEKQDPNNLELQTTDDRYHYDGKFIANPRLLGSWTAVAMVPTFEAFDPARPDVIKNAPFGGLTLKESGLTDKAVRIWSGDTLIDMTRWEALKMTVRTIAGTEYLGVEAGGFSEKNPAGWKSPLIVMKRSQ
ncbi:MAG: DUF6288 domain-containing protein [Chthoniobacter sp.]|nr:DUF6288 domain-containing protein [Chthoniobacter sp.]